MRLKGKKFRKSKRSKKKERKVSGVVTSRSLKLLYKHLSFKLPTEHHVPFGACRRHFEWFPHSKALLEVQKMEGIEHPSL